MGCHIDYIKRHIWFDIENLSVPPLLITKHHLCIKMIKLLLLILLIIHFHITHLLNKVSHIIILLNI